MVRRLDRQRGSEVLGRPGTILSAVREGKSIVAFEVDQMPDGPGAVWWSVLVQGLAAAVDDERADAGRLTAAPTSAVPEPGRAIVRIRVEILSGRRFLATVATRQVAEEANGPGWQR